MKTRIVLILGCLFVIGSGVEFKCKKRAYATIEGDYEGSKIKGHVIFDQLSLFYLQVSVQISGIPPNLGPLHGFHVHTNGILNSSDNTTVRCLSAGAHYNPFHQTHGNISARYRHLGDYGNLVADKNGTIHTKFHDRLSTLYGPFSIIGRTIILHQNEDDLGLKPDKHSKINGNSGPPIACGIIGVLSCYSSL